MASGDFFEIDGSVMEGGGQVLRMSAGLSALLARPIRIVKVRAGRAKPGLKSQHSSGLCLIRDLTRGQLEGATIGSGEVSLRPGPLSPGHFTADTQTAGAVCLLAQISLPCAVFAPGPVSLDLKGGTNCDMAPQIDEFTEILLPNLKKFGVTVEYDVVRKGFFPQGGGNVNFFIKPIKTLQPVIMKDPGKVEKIYGWSFVAGNLPLRVAEQMTEAATKHLNASGCDDIHNIPIKIDTYKESRECCQSNGSGIVLVAKTSTGCILGGSALGSSKLSSHKTGIKAAEEFLEAVECGGCVDKHIQDQLIIFMALAPGRSGLVAKKLNSAKFTLENCQDNNSGWLITCEGIGFTNKYP